MTSLNTSSYFSRDDISVMFNINEDIIDSLDINHKNDGVYVSIKLKKAFHTCPVCEAQTDKIKDYRERKILHSVLTSTPCFIMYRARRYQCHHCKKPFFEHNPFSHMNMKVSVVTVSNVLNDLKHVGETFKSVALRYGLSPTTVSSIFDAHVFISRKRLPEFLCIDECYAYSGSNGNYVCVLIDFKSKETVDLLPSRKKQDLIRYFDRIPLEERKNVKLLCIDMWETYRIVAQDKLPNCKISVDRFHIMQEINRKLKTVRTRVMNRNRYIKPTRDVFYKAKAGEAEAIIITNEYYQKDQMYYLLKKFDWLLFLSYENQLNTLNSSNEMKYNHKLKRYLNYRQIRDLILDSDSELKEVYEFMRDMQIFYRTATYDNATERLESLISKCNQSRIKELTDFGNTLIRWKREIINSFIIVYTYTKNGEQIEVKMNNGIAENKNRTLKLLKNNSNGYKNWDRFRNRSLYVLNENDTYHLNPIKK